MTKTYRPIMAVGAQSQSLRWLTRVMCHRLRQCVSTRTSAPSTGWRVLIVTPKPWQKCLKNKEKRCALKGMQLVGGERVMTDRQRNRGGRFACAPIAGAHHRQAGVQPLARAAGGTVHPSLHRHGLRLLRVLETAAGRRPRCRRQGGAGVLGGRRHVRREVRRHAQGAVRHGLQLEPVRPRLDVHVLLRAARHFGGDLGRMARARRAAQGGSRLGAVLVRRPVDRRARRLHPSALADVARRRRDRRHRPRPRLHLAGLDAHQVVPRPARHGDWHGHHGLRRRRHDRLTACHHPDERPTRRCLHVHRSLHGDRAHARLERLSHRDRRRRLADLHRHGRDLFRLHADRRLRLPAAADRLATRRVDAARQRQPHDHVQQRAPQGCAQDAAVLAVVDHPLPQRVGRHRHHRRGLAHAAGDLRRPAHRQVRARLPRHSRRTWRW